MADSTRANRTAVSENLIEQIPEILETMEKMKKEIREGKQNQELLCKEVRDMKNANMELQKEMKDLIDENRRLDETNKGLEKVKGGLQKEIKDLKGENRMAHEKIKALEKKIAEGCKEEEFKTKAERFIQSMGLKEESDVRRYIDMLSSKPDILLPLEDLEGKPMLEKINGYHEVFKTGLTVPTQATPVELEKPMTYLRRLASFMSTIKTEIMTGVVVIVLVAGAGYVCFTYGPAAWNALTSAAPVAEAGLGGCLPLVADNIVADSFATNALPFA